jgi:RimJ/RimL family protein N-acetyltransferase
LFEAVEPADDAHSVSAELARAWNDSYNHAMTEGSGHYSPERVVLNFKKLREHGGRPFVLYRDGKFAGDADFRNIDLHRGSAEFVIMIASRAWQGKGFGTRFAVLLHVLGFGALGLRRTHVAILRDNTPSLRLFAKLGYRIDTSEEARAYTDAPSDLTMTLRKQDFEREWGEFVPKVAIQVAGE